MLGAGLQARQPFDTFAASFADTVQHTVAVVGFDAPGADDSPGVPDGLTMTVRLATHQTDGSIRRYRGAYEIAREKLPDPFGRPGYAIQVRIVGANITPE